MGREDTVSFFEYGASRKGHPSFERLGEAST